MALTIEDLHNIWKTEFIVHVRRAISGEIKGLKEDMAALRKRFDDIEASQSFLSTKYDTVLATILGVKMQAETTERQIKGIECRALVHSPCFPLTLTSRVTAKIVYF